MTIRKARWATAALAATSLVFGVVTANAQPAPAKPAPAKPATAAAPAAGALKPAPAAVILYLDRATILRKSAAGVELQKQAEAIAKKIQTDLGPEDKKLHADIQSLQAQADVLSPQARQAKIKEIETRRQALQKKVQERQVGLQNGISNARTQMERALSPILEKILVERKANLLLDRGLVVVGVNELDITNVAIERLNKALPRVTVTPVAPKPAAPAKPAAAPAKPGG
ncbi:MAG: OmpH family outer membrane protein [Alphaproteobacteria bacterium]